MCDTVVVTAPIHYVCFPQPKRVAILLSDEEVGDHPTLTVEQLPSHALDALAKTWLDQLFAGVGRSSPFAYKAADAGN